MSAIAATVAAILAASGIGQQQPEPINAGNSGQSIFSVEGTTVGLGDIRPEPKAAGIRRNTPVVRIYPPQAVEGAPEYARSEASYAGSGGDTRAAAVESPPVVANQPATSSGYEPPAPSRASTDATTHPNVSPVGSSLLDCIARYESNGYGDKRNPTYRGRYQFSRSTFAAVGGSGDPANASPAEQDKRARILISREGLKPWPVPSRYCSTVRGG